MPRIADRVEESTTSTGTGSVTLAGAASGYRAFSAAFLAGDAVYYSINAGSEWEVGIGTVGAGTLSRDTVLASSNGGAKVSFSAGTKRVFCTAPADRLDAQPSGYRIVLLMGQSNMQGAASTPDNVYYDTTDPNVLQWPMGPTHPRAGNIIQVADAALSYPDNTTGITTPGSWFARHYARNVGSQVVLIPAAVGATRMVGDRWMPSLTPGAGGDLFEAAVSAANACVAYAKARNPGSFFDGMIWCQGESDGDAGIGKASYSSALALLIQAVRARVTGASGSWALVMSMPYETMQSWSTAAGIQQVHYAQIETAAATPRCKFVPSTRGDTIAPGSNRHRTAEGVRKMGGACAAMVASAVAKVAAETLPSPVQVTGVTSTAVSDTSLTLSWDAAPGADTYTVQMSNNGGGSWSNVARTWGDTNSMSVTGLTASTAYLFRVTGVWTGTSGTVSASHSVTTASAATVAPAFTTQPTAQSVTAGSTATFTVAVSGSPTPTVQWQRNPGGNTSFADISGATSLSYTTPATTVSGGSANNGDTYRCVATNIAGSATSSAVALTVGAAAVAPTVTTQPTAQTVTAGQTATFTAAFAGTPTPTVQWQRNPGGNTAFADISGATSLSYTTPATTVSGGSANSTDTYRCVATNTAGTVTTNTVALTVNPLNSTITYDFEADTVGSAPANTTSIGGTWQVASPTIAGATYGKSLALTALAGSNQSVIAFGNATVAALGDNQEAVWRRGMSPTGTARDGVVLRCQTATAGGGYANCARGYWFHIGSHNGTVIIYRMDSGGPVQIGNGSFSDIADQWWRARVNGSAISLESSPDGTTWTSRATATDSTYTVAQRECQYMAIAGTNFNIDQITFKAL